MPAQHFSGVSLHHPSSQPVIQDFAGAVEDYLKGFLSDEEIAAYGREPWLKDMFMGQAVHRATASELRSGGYQYRTRGPDFLDPASNEIELTTPGQVAAHARRPGYDNALYATYSFGGRMLE